MMMLLFVFLIIGIIGVIVNVATFFGKMFCDGLLFLIKVVPILIILTILILGICEVVFQ